MREDVELLFTAEHAVMALAWIAQVRKAHLGIYSAQSSFQPQVKPPTSDSPSRDGAEGSRKSDGSGPWMNLRRGRAQIIH